jgi:hypothetical protein
LELTTALPDHTFDKTAATMGTVDSIQYAWHGAPWQHAATAISLHSHTSHSKERLDFIPRLSSLIPILGGLVRAQERRYCDLHGHEFNYFNAWWTPPLSPREALSVERRQIEELGLRPFVSLTDHDTIEAPLLVRVLPEGRDVPVSLEWTVPYRGTFFHLGVHNLPPRSASGITAELNAFTASPREELIRPLLAALTEAQETLVVFNHPCWDEKRVGRAPHDALAREFLTQNRDCLHALEVNGIRPWTENLRAVELASAFGRPVISGGDRHCCEPNALLNITNAASFEEFVDEVRRDARSQVLVMPQYREPLACRLMRAIADVMRDNESHAHGWVRWSDRVFFRREDGAVEALSSVWGAGTGPMVIRAFARVAQSLDSRSLQAAMRQISSTAHEIG